MSREKQSGVSLLLSGYGPQHVLKAAMAMKIAKDTSFAAKDSIMSVQ
jgi:hypothetical protein